MAVFSFSIVLVPAWIAIEFPVRSIDSANANVAALFTRFSGLGLRKRSDGKVREISLLRPTTRGGAKILDLRTQT